MTDRIVMIVPAFPQVSETFIVNKFKGLKDKGLDVHLFCDRINRDFPFLDEIPMDRVIENFPKNSKKTHAPFVVPWALFNCILKCPALTVKYFRFGWKKWKLGVIKRFYLDAKLLMLRPSLVHFEFGALALDREYLAEILEASMVVSFRGFDINYCGLDQPGFYSTLFDSVSGIHFLGRDLRKRALNRGLSPEKRHVLIPPAIDTRFFAKAAGTAPPRGEHDLRIVSIGRLHWKKGYEYSLMAIRLLLDRGYSVTYDIIGEGDFKDAVLFCRDQLGLRDTCRLLGNQPPAKVREHLSQSHVFLHGAVSEGFCNSVLEAQAMGIAVVTTDADGLSENVVDSETGFVVPRRNARALADAMEKLITSPETRKSMGDAGRRRVETKFRIEDQIEAFCRFYSEVLEARR